jgi:hypothetical protein
LAEVRSLYQKGNDQNGNVSTSIRVKETTRNIHLVVGGSAPSGVSVTIDFGYVYGSLGVAALRKF